MTANISETAKDVVRRNTEEVQGRGNWALFNELFADEFFDHTPQPGGSRDKAGVLALYKRSSCRSCWVEGTSRSSCTMHYQ